MLMPGNSKVEIITRINRIMSTIKKQQKEIELLKKKVTELENK